jgi:spore coat protein A
VHLHGGHTASGSDGLPDAWFVQNNAETGPGFTDKVYTYANDQDAATLWYHDHALGVTRLNVYAGLAGFYLLRDATENALVEAGVLPGGPYEIEMAIQDRAFTSDGKLYYPAFADDPIPGTSDTVADSLPPDYEDRGGTFPSIMPEFFGDFILVNGMAWPKLDVAPGDYRFRMLNGSDSRFYVLKPDDPNVKVTLVGTDGGLLPQAIAVIDGIDAGNDGLPDAGEQIVLAPGDRLDLVFDFGQVAGEAVTLLNVGPAFEPFKGLTTDGSLAGGAAAATTDDSVGQIMRFNVAEGPSIDNATVDDGTVLNPDFHPLSEASANVIRKLGVFESSDEFGRVEGHLGVAEDTTDINGDPVPFGPLMWEDPITETPQLGATEIWEFYNFTEDAHPVHVHQVQFQVLGKQQISFTDDLDNATSEDGEDGLPDDINHDGRITIGPEGSDNDVFTFGDVSPPSPEESGAQDTVFVAPGEVLRVIAQFDIRGEFVWHCHILSHEDHEMMRPYEVVE